MLVILNNLNAHNLPIFQHILMILVSKFMVYRALSDKTYLSVELLSPLSLFTWKRSAKYSANPDNMVQHIGSGKGLHCV